MPADRQQQKTPRRAKAASLSSLLLVRNEASSPKGFVVPFEEARNRREGETIAEPEGASATLAAKGRPDAAPASESPPARDVPYDAQHLVRALREGDLSKAERLFAQLSELTPHTARRIFHGTAGHDLAIACRALGLDQLQFVSILILSRKLGEGDPDGQPEQLAAAIETYEEHRPAAARELLDIWRRDGFAPQA